MGVLVITKEALDKLIDENELLQETLKTFAYNVKQTNAEIDKNWAETVYPLKAENQRFREALEDLANNKYHSIEDYQERAREALEQK